MKYGKMILIAYHLLESSTSAYIEWLVNKLMLTPNRIEYKDTCLSNASCRCNKPTSQVALHILGVFSFLLTGKSCGEQLSTQGLFYPVADDRNVWS